VATEVFGRIYSQIYDALYQDKDYLAECDLLEQVFRQYGGQGVKTVLDLGCGTGNYLIPLAQRGYRMTGVDRSEDMLAAAQEKANRHGLAVNLHHGDVRTVDLGRTFDTVVMMFAVLGYQTKNADVAAALLAARRHLKPSGLLVFDIWYGPAVLAERPTDRVKVIPTADGSILRAASGELDIRHHTCHVRYRLWHLQDDRVVAETTEEHVMRYFFPMELEYFLAQAGFDLARLGAFPDIERNADETTWNVMAIAVAC